MAIVFQEKNLIKNYIKELKRRNKRFKIGKSLRPKSIKPLEREYFKILKLIINKIKELFKEEVANQIGSIIREYQSERPKKDSFKSDDFIDSIEQAFKNAKLKFNAVFNDEEYAKYADQIASKTNRYNKNNFDSNLKKILGINIVASEPWLASQIKSFTKSNVALIKSIPEDAFSKLEQKVIRDITAGKLTKEISEDLQNTFDVTENRAALIARDQVGKFNGNLNELRQKSVGVEKYIWRTSMDERVRPDHAEREGEEFNWDNAPEDGHPGEPINCRCYAEPVFEE